MKGESLFALLTGAAVGAAIGILFAPDKGSETRKKIKEAAEEGYEDVKDKTADLRHEASVRTRYARRELADIRKELSEKGEKLTDAARKKLIEKLEKLEDALSKDDDAAVGDEAQPEA